MKKRQGRGRSGVAAVTQLRTQLNGGKSTPRSVDPPQVTLQPWYPLVVNIQQGSPGTAKSYNVSNLVDRLVAQLNLSVQSKPDINVRIKRVVIWNAAIPSDDDRPSVNLKMSSFIPVVADPVSPGPTADVDYPIFMSATDAGSLSRPAKAGITLPMLQAKQVLSNANQFTVFEAVGGGGKFATIHVHLEWCSSGVATPVT